MPDATPTQVYLNSLKEGERVIETGITAMFGREGDVYIHDHGYVCVKWDAAPGETGRMSTSATHGTRRISDLKELARNIKNEPEEKP